MATDATTEHKRSNDNVPQRRVATDAGAYIRAAAFTHNRLLGLQAQPTAAFDARLQRESAPGIPIHARRLADASAGGNQAAVSVDCEPLLPRGGTSISRRAANTSCWLLLSKKHAASAD